MGCCTSALGFYARHPQYLKDQAEFETLMFKEGDIAAFYKIFQKVDTSGDGDIDVDELLVYLNIDMSKFAHRVFSMFDADKSGQIDFKEFVLCCWNYCTLGRATLVLFAFDLYDADHSGEIDNREIGKMLRDIYGKDYETNTYAKKLMERILKELGTEITIAEFREFVRKYPALLFPAFQLQDGIAQRVMGGEFWKYFSERRMNLSGGRYIEIGEFMALHTNQGAAEAVLGAHDGFETANGHKAVDVHKEKVKNVLSKTGTIQNRMSSKGGSMKGGFNEDTPLAYSYTKGSCVAAGSMDTDQPVATRFASPKGKKPTIKSPSGPPPGMGNAAADKQKLGLMRIQSGKELDDHGKLSDYFQDMESNHRRPRRQTKNAKGTEEDYDEDRLSDEDEMTTDRSSRFLQPGSMSLAAGSMAGERSSSKRMGSMAAGDSGATPRRRGSVSRKEEGSGATPRRRGSVSRKEEDEERSASTRSFKSGMMSMNVALGGGNDSSNNNNASQKDKHYRLKGDRSPHRSGDSEGSARNQLTGAMAAAGPHRTAVDSSIAVGLYESEPAQASYSSTRRRQSRGELSLTGGSIRAGSMNVMGSSASMGSVGAPSESKKRRGGGSTEPTMSERVAAAQAAGAAGSTAGNSGGASQTSEKGSSPPMFGDNFYSGKYYEGPTKSRK